MSDSAKHMPIPDDIERQASIWLLRCDRGLTAADQDHFLQWLAEDRLHGECFNAQQRDWERLNLLAEWRPKYSVRPNPDLLVPAPRRRSWYFPAISLAAAAAIALGAFLAWPRPEIRIANPHSATAIAAIRQHVFEDGSITELNRGSEIVVLYTSGERRVRLERGEVYFNVAKDPGRPFIVNASGVEVRAVGTAFTVRSNPMEVEVLVKEGKVKVAATETERKSPASVGDDPTTLTASERIVVPLTTHSIPAQVDTITGEEMNRRLAWQPRMLDFTGAPLAEIVEVFNGRNAPIELVIADPALREFQLSATLRSDNVEGFIRFLETAFDVQADRAGNTITLRRASAKATGR